MSQKLYEDKLGFVYLGYRLQLTVTECAVLRLLLLSGGYVRAEALTALAGVSAGNISRTVRGINQKAEKIGNRPFILTHKTQGYCLAEYL